MRAILTYHSVDWSGSAISVDPAAFSAHHRWLTSGRVRTLALDELLSHPDEASDAVSVTFDDGFLNARAPMERLLADGVPVTAFVVTGRVGTVNAWSTGTHGGIPTLPLLSWTDLERLLDRGVRITSHSHTHVPLTGLSAEALDEELLGSREELRRRLGVNSLDVAYPYGALDAVVAARAARHFTRGYGTRFHIVRGGEDALRLPRLDMRYFSAPDALGSWGSRSFQRRLAWIRARRAVRGALLDPPRPPRGGDGTMGRGSRP